MMLGLRDYVGKNGFPGIVLGHVRRHRLGADRRGRRRRARTGARARRAAAVALHERRQPGRRRPSRRRLLGMRLETLAIEGPSQRSRQTLAAACSPDRPRDVTEENLQARARGVLLMALSNKFGRPAGDDRQQVGDVGRLRHALRRHVRRLFGAEGRLQDRGLRAVALAQREAADGALGPVGRSHSASRPSRRRRRPNCGRTRPTRTRCLPTRSSTPFCTALVEEELSVDDIVARGFARDTVTRVQRLLYSAEYKRRQAPPGVKITRRSFGRDRRYPITNAFREK